MDKTHGMNIYEYHIVHIQNECTGFESNKVIQMEWLFLRINDTIFGKHEGQLVLQA